VANQAWQVFNIHFHANYREAMSNNGKNNNVVV
jgi:hypothetical protein